VTLNWSAIAGVKYRVQFKNNFNEVNWSDLAPDVTAASSFASITDNSGAVQRFYRILVLN
jgi:hypothetical protein